MKAVLQIELIGENIRESCRLAAFIVDSVLPGMGSEYFSAPAFSWVARIAGPDKRYRWAREFLKARRDYRFSNSTGSRGIMAVYELESGCVYEVKARLSWRKIDRYFCYVTDEGEIIRLTEPEVKRWFEHEQVSAE